MQSSESVAHPGAPADSTDSISRGRLRGLLKCLSLGSVLLDVLRTGDFEFRLESVARHLVDRMILRLYPQRFGQPLLHFSITAESVIGFLQPLA